MFNLVLIANLNYEAKGLNLRNPYEVLCQKLFLNLAILLRFSLAHSCVIACHSNQRRLVGGVIRGRWVRAPDGLRGFGGRAPQPPEAKPGNFGP